jgi:secreted protein with Ig-like and vWFA domain
MSRYDILLNDPKKQEPPAKAQQPSASKQPTIRPADESAIRPGDQTTSKPDDDQAGRREFIRRGFEWYADQLRALKKLSLEEQMEGKPGNMSQMVREALDDYLKKRAAER